MKNSHLLSALSAIVLLTFVSTTSNAALVPRLGGLAVYSTDQNITWLADANLAASNTFGLTRSATLSGGGEAFFGEVGPNGEMDQFTASSTWISAMNSDGGSGYLGVNTWRLANTVFPDTGCSIDGTGIGEDAGFNCSASEMGHLFYNELGGVAGSSILTSTDPDLALFSNIQADWYWSATAWPIFPAYWAFNFSDGHQFAEGNEFIGYFAWAVADGDVLAPVPIPAAIWLFGSGLIGLIGIARRK